MRNRECKYIKEQKERQITGNREWDLRKRERTKRQRRIEPEGRKEGSCALQGTNLPQATGSPHKAGVHQREIQNFKEETLTSLSRSLQHQGRAPLPAALFSRHPKLEGGAGRSCAVAVQWLC